MSEEDSEQPVADIRLGCEPPTRRIAERLDEPIQAPGECRLYRGHPCLLFEDWDYAEDWSGEYVRVIASEPLERAPSLSTAEFWALVRQVHTF